MRALALILLIACKPSASVERTMPVANLQTYRSVALRVHSSTFASQGVAMMMESSVLQRLKQTCGFEQVGPAGATPADVILDLNITNKNRGAGWNDNTVVIETLLVLSDGVDGELLGTAKVRGKSSGSVMNSGPQDSEAIEVIATTIAEMLAKSGCSGPRIARAPEPLPDTGGASQGSAGIDTGAGSAAAPDETRRAEAEAHNEQGKSKLFAADMAGALAAFTQANATLPDAKYQFNVCVTLGAQERWAEATSACEKARGMNPSAKLTAKIDQRLEGLRQQR